VSKVVCIIQARIGSARLPAKVLRELCGKPMLAHVIQRVKEAKTVDEIIIATTTNESDSIISELALSMRVKVFRGSEQDVLSRYLGAAKEAGAGIVIRITSDCPLIDPNTIDAAVRYFTDNSYDYIQACSETGFPRGLDTEVFTFKALEKVNGIASESSYREHVTLYMYRHPEEFKIGYYKAPKELNHPEWRLCVDEINDFNLIEIIYKALYKEPYIIAMSEVADLLEKRTELLEINKDVKQKTV